MPTDPLAKLQEQIGEARKIPSPLPFTPSPKPLDRLFQMIDDARHGREPDQDLGPGTGPTTGAAADGATSSIGTPSASSTAPAMAAGPMDAVVGQQILRTLEGRPLSGAARAEAIRRLSLAMQNPSGPNLEAVLDVLLSGNPDSGQSR